MSHMFDVFVPANAALDFIAPGSGIVGRNGSDASEEGILLDYEGNLYDSASLKTWADRVYHAAGRAAVNYPTVARRLVGFDDVYHVAFFTSGDTKVQIAAPALREAVCKWLGITDAELDEQLQVTSR